MNRILLVSLLACLCLTARAVDVRPLSDKPDFVEAYLLMIDPGGELYSCAGHAALRLKCADEKLDYVFSYESENVKERMLTFLSGRLKMGMARWPTEKCLSLYREDKRGMCQYRLNLPGDVKCRLWKVMDDEVAKGMLLPYDYLERGCTQATFRFLMAAAEPHQIVVRSWPERLKGTQREIFCSFLDAFPWNRFFAESIVGIDADLDLPIRRKVVIPEDLLNLLKQSSVCGKTVIVDQPETLVPSVPLGKKSWFSPVVAAGLFAALVIVGVVFRVRALQVLALSVYCIFAAFYTYLIAFSTLPATRWHWLAVPFNLLPLVFWKWRRKWALPFCVVLVLWEAFVLLNPHLITDPAYYIVVAAYIVYFAKQGTRG